MRTLGESVTLEGLESDPHGIFAALRPVEPVAWVPALSGWLVTRRDLVVEMMRDAETFTVDDPRFSTGQVVGPSMLSLDGAEHVRHRTPFANAFRLPEVRSRFTGFVEDEAARLVDELAPRGRGELRRGLAGPLAVNVMAEALGLRDVDPAEILAWYDDIVDAVSRVSTGQVLDDGSPAAFELLARHVSATISAGDSLVADAARTLSTTEVVSNTAVLMFGGIDTSEGMTANAFAHLLADPALWRMLDDDPDLIASAIDESLRFEPAVVQVDRFATRDVDVDGVTIGKGDFVILSIAGANRDPAVFPDPDRFDPTRPNTRAHLAFAHGPHACLGIHLAKLETRAAIHAAVKRLPGIRLAVPVRPTGLVFRKPLAVEAVWAVDT